jgi:hypothetical protein
MIDIILFVIGTVLLLSTIRELVVVARRINRTERFLEQLDKDAQKQWRS